MTRPAITPFLFAMLVLAGVAAFGGLTACGDDDDDNEASTAADDDDDTSDDDTSDDDTDDDDTAGDDDDTGDDDTVDDDDTADDDTGDDDTIDEYFDPKEWGPYPVGNRRYVFIDEDRPDDRPSDGPRTLLTDVWYPATDESTDLPRTRVGDFLTPWENKVSLLFGLAGAPDDELANFDNLTHSAFEAPIRADAGPFPIVFVSHGNMSLRFAHWTLCEYLASHGYVVVSVDHIGNAIFVTLPDRLVLFNFLHYPVALINRKADMRFLVDTFTALNDDDPDGVFTGMIDTDAVGALGHSFGGRTLIDWVPEDERVVAAVDMAAMADPAEVAKTDASWMLMAAGEDNTIGEWHPVSATAENPAKVVAMEILDAGHYTFSEACYLMPTLFGDGDGCGTGHRHDGGAEFEYLDPAVGFDIMNSYVTAFFGYHLKNQDEMLPDLTTNRYPEEMLFEVTSVED
ncbi:MAG: hypothetical protein H6684_02740 [Deltaproteobacteria bacterium]|nr:hypothetical protein [Deltaproteobacteria bacterium]